MSIAAQATRPERLATHARVAWTCAWEGRARSALGAAGAAAGAMAAAEQTIAATTDEFPTARMSLEHNHPDREDMLDMRMIFVNLPVKDLEATKRFFGALGFEFNPDFSDDQAACMVIDDNIFAMLMVEERFADFINGDIADAHTATEVLVALSAGSRQEVDDTIAKALQAGGKPWKPAADQPPMYGGSFQDLDGHVWELVYMEQ